MPIKAAIFDLDGTIADFNLDYKTLRAEVRLLLMDCGFPPSLFSVTESIFEMLKKAEIYLRNNGGSKKDVEEVKKRVFAMADKYEVDAARRTSLLPGVMDALTELKKMNLKMAVFTISGEKAANYILRTFRLKNFFSVVVTRERVPMVKPDPAHLEAALKLLVVPPEETVVVGDSVSDMKSANLLGAFPIGVTTGYSSPKQLTNAGAKCLITSLVDLPVLIKRLNEQDKTGSSSG